jgi:hypothetical protein
VLGGLAERPERPPRKRSLHQLDWFNCLENSAVGKAHARVDRRRHAAELADHQGAYRADGTIFEAIIREGAEAGEFDVEDAAEAARAVRSAFMTFFHPILIEHCVEHGEDTEAGLRDQIRFILKALGKSG